MDEKQTNSQTGITTLEPIKDKIKIIITKKEFTPTVSVDLVENTDNFLPACDTGNFLSDNKNTGNLLSDNKNTGNFLSVGDKNTGNCLPACDTSLRRYFCYILKNRQLSDINKTYNGFTVDLKKRIRQHNSEIKGGAKYTTSNGNKTWYYYAILTGFHTDVSALSCEWWIKHPTGHRKRPFKYCGPSGRILGLQKVIEETRFKGYDPTIQYTLWIDKTYLDCLNQKTIKPNIQIMTFTTLDDITKFYLAQ